MSWTIAAAVLAFVATAIANIEIIARPFRLFHCKLKALLEMPMALEAMQLHFESEMEDVKCTLRCLQLKGLSRVIADNCMPIDARYDACIDYIQLGGNGAIKQMYEDEIIPEYNNWLKERSGVK